MLPKYHLLYGMLFSLVLYFLFNVSFTNSLIFFAASVLIDADHYLFYFFTYRDFSMKNAYLWHKNLPNNHKPIMHIFHSIEFIALVFLISIIFPFFVFILAGMLFHSSFWT